jgi:small nuclear ribonucleoprotein (snRNP)-like protein
MTERDLQVLKASIDKVVRIVYYDGETILARVHAISDEDQDVIYDLVSTTRPSQYEKHDEQPAYLIKFESIEHVEPFRNS